MKFFLRVILSMSIMVVFTELGFADEYTFRKTKWGMTVSQVKSSETLTVSDYQHEEGREGLMYKTTVINKSVLLFYLFVDNKLVNAMYSLQERHTNKNDYITDYEDFKDVLISKYGRPQTDEVLWKNDLFKNKGLFDNGTCISLGHLQYASVWETQDTRIVNRLYGENFNISCGVAYFSRELEELVKGYQKKKDKKAF